MLSKFGLVTILIATIGLSDLPSAFAETPAVGSRSEMPSLAPMLERVLPGVVAIAVHGRIQAQENPLLADPFFRRFFGAPEQPQEREFQAAGSGVIVDAEKGYVITNNHVVENADEVTVVLSDGRRMQAKKVGTDPATDIAVVRIPPERLSGLPVGDSDSLRVGDYVVAVGNPFGLAQTVTSGIVSALGRTGLGIEGYESFIQTDASINPGNSGGALVNLRGELVGINSAIIGPSGGNVGIGFAIPINMARQVMEQLVTHGKVSRGQLGVRVQDLTPDLAKAFGIEAGDGALIANVTQNSPAAKAGLKAGDVVTALNGQRVRSAAELRNRIGLLPVGTEVRLDVVHKGSARLLTLRLAEAVPEKLVVPEAVPGLSGVTLASIEPGSPLYGRVQGALVQALKPGSVAMRAGLRVGDVIVGVDQQAVGAPDDVVAIASKVKGSLLLQILRDGSALFIVIG